MKKKRLSKRVKTKSRVKISKKVRAAFRKEKLKERHFEKTILKLPKSVLLLDSEKEQIEFIKEQTKMRTEAAQNEERESLPPHMEKLKSLINSVDIFIEIIDQRDVTTSRSYDVEKRIIDANKRLVLFIPNFNEKIPIQSHSSIPLQSHPSIPLQSVSLEMIHDIRDIPDGPNYCIFGQPRSGKFLLSKALLSRNPDAKVTRLQVPSSVKTLSAMLRGAIDENSIDSLVHFQQVWDSIDRARFRDYYMLRSFTSCEECLDALAASMNCTEARRRTREVAAFRFFKDVKSGLISWMKLPDQQFMFVFPEHST